MTSSDRNGELRIRQLELQVTRLQEQLKAKQRATELQASEYERRLTALNHAHEQALEVQKTTVTADKFEEYVKTESQAREAALLRVDEKIADQGRVLGGRVSRVESMQGKILGGLVVIVALIPVAVRLLGG
jgi:chromosome condensin MukBEF ATPase and DNA-binding subunit MukB